MFIDVTIMNEMTINRFNKSPRDLLTNFRFTPIRVEVLSKSLVYYKDGIIYPGSGMKDKEGEIEVFPNPIHPVLDKCPKMINGHYLFCTLPGNNRYLMTEISSFTGSYITNEKLTDKNSFIVIAY